MFSVLSVNNVIDNLAGKADGVEVTDQDLGNLEAECLFLRAFSLFHCVLTYAQPYSYNPDSPGVPVVLHTDPEGKPARETVAKVYERITADLLRAESIIDPEYVRRDGTDPKVLCQYRCHKSLSFQGISSHGEMAEGSGLCFFGNRQREL